MDYYTFNYANDRELNMTNMPDRATCRFYRETVIISHLLDAQGTGLLSDRPFHEAEPKVTCTLDQARPLDFQLMSFGSDWQANGSECLWPSLPAAKQLVQSWSQVRNSLPGELAGWGTHDGNIAHFASNLLHALALPEDGGLVLRVPVPPL